MKKDFDKFWLIGIGIGILIALIILLIILIPKGNIGIKEKEFYCDVNLENISCVSDYTCRNVNMVCDLNIGKCISPNINLEGQVIIGTEEDCEEIGGLWKQK